jgi:hypothetical protein
MNIKESKELQRKSIMYRKEKIRIKISATQVKTSRKYWYGKTASKAKTDSPRKEEGKH